MDLLSSKIFNSDGGLTCTFENNLERFLSDNSLPNLNSILPFFERVID